MVNSGRFRRSPGLQCPISCRFVEDRINAVLSGFKPYGSSNFCCKAGGAVAESRYRGMSWSVAQLASFFQLV